jgi:hypothetical protein
VVTHDLFLLRKALPVNLPDDQHFAHVLRAIQVNRLVPFFGAGVNLANRPRTLRWEPGGQYLPSGAELSTLLAEIYNYPENDKWDLLRVAQYVAVENGTGALYEDLRKIFDADFESTPVHEFFAHLPELLRRRNVGENHLLILTTNYDDMMERSLTSAGEQFDVVTYVADGEDAGKFRHLLANGESVLIRRPNEYLGVSLDHRHVVLKIHGNVDRSTFDGDSYVITEDHYIDYLTHSNLGRFLPATILKQLQRAQFLFLGYSLRDWNLRVILHRISQGQKLKYKSWSIQRNPKPIECRFWQKKDIEILDLDVADYIAKLRTRVEELPVSGGAL